MICAIGNSPSSGSTLLADILDSSKKTACGDEINIFSNKRFYDYSNFRKNIYQKSISSEYFYSERIRFQDLSFYGLNEFHIEKLFLENESVIGFVNEFRERYLALRDKDENAILFEKTPQNINCINNFLSTFNDSYFIVVLRNPLYVFNSMINRGFSPYISFITWYFEALKAYKYRDDSRVIFVKYEDLVLDPFRYVSKLIKRISNFDIDENLLKKDYENNRYRNYFTHRLSTWSVKKSSVVLNANNKVIDNEVISIFLNYKNAEISQQYANFLDVPIISYNKLVKYFGYENDVNTLFSCENVDVIKLKRRFKDHFFLIYKFIKAYRYGDVKLKYLYGFMNQIKWKK